MVNADVDDIPEPSVITTGDHKYYVLTSHFSYFLVAENDVPKLATRTGCTSEV